MTVTDVTINKILKSSELRRQRKTNDPKLAKISAVNLSALKELQRTNGYKSIDATIEALMLAVVLMKLSKV